MHRNETKRSGEREGERERERERENLLVPFFFLIYTVCVDQTSVVILRALHTIEIKTEKVRETQREES